MPLPKTLALATLSIAAMLVLPACSAAGATGYEVTDDEDSSETGSGITSQLPVGTVLRTTADLNLRSGPSTSKSILDVVPKGDEVTVLESAPVGRFYHVSYGAKSGWCSGRYLEATEVDDGEPWTCEGSFGKTKVSGGQYYATSFGCWVDADGDAHSDSGDNCIPACLSKARSDGLCAGLSGPECERSVNWYAADAGRFGCLERLRVTNPANGRTAVVVALDYGPACWVERKVEGGVLDLSSAVTAYLFGGARGAVDRAKVRVVEVPRDTPLGPVH